MDTETFQKILDPEDNTTGGGSASAVAGAMAAALIAKVCRLSAITQSAGGLYYNELAGQAQELSELLLAGGAEDTLAFQAVSLAYRLPMDTDDERRMRSQAIESAWVNATSAPLENAKRCAQALKLGAGLVGRINPRVACELSCALLLARAGLLGCLENLAINLPSIKDQDTAARLAKRAGDLRRELADLDSSLKELLDR